MFLPTIGVSHSNWTEKSDIDMETTEQFWDPGHQVLRYESMVTLSGE